MGGVAEACADADAALSLVDQCRLQADGQVGLGGCPGYSGEHGMARSLSCARVHGPRWREAVRRR